MYGPVARVPLADDVVRRVVGDHRSGPGGPRVIAVHTASRGLGGSGGVVLDHGIDEVEVGRVVVDAAAFDTGGVPVDADHRRGPRRPVYAQFVVVVDASAILSRVPGDGGSRTDDQPVVVVDAAACAV